MTSRQNFAAILALIATVRASEPVFATEKGGQMYPVGVYTIVPGMVPPPGQTWLQNYGLYYSAGVFKDGDGKALIPGYALDVAAYAARFVHSWDVKVGPFGLASALVVPVVYSSGKTAISSDKDSGIGDLDVGSLYLTYVNDARTFFAYAGVDFFVPTDSPVSRRYTSTDPILAMTWFPAKGVDVSLVTLLELPLSENTVTNYRSGNLFVAEFSGHGQVLPSLPMLTVGLTGYWVQQFSSDKVGGIDIGFEGEAFAIGPELVYQIGQQGGFALKWQHEMDVRNRPQGDQFLLQVQVPLGG